MTDRDTPPIPAASAQSFEDGIRHPDLWLWDSWTYFENGIHHLYTLALSRRDTHGAMIHHENRNDHPFHFRHFTSGDQGLTWTDAGSILAPDERPNSFYSRNIWSGSAIVLRDGRKLIGFTGIREVDDERPFLQSLGFATSKDGYKLDHIQPSPLSCPQRDYDAIIAAGYYLGPRKDLGHQDGEEGGPILAWRDPYTFFDSDHRLHCFWSAKVSPTMGAIAHATLIESASGFEIETLHPPITLPDGDSITQAEVPKVYFDIESQTYYCLISACDRICEEQEASEVSKTLRLYKSSNLRGPWESYRDGSPILEGLPHMFGASVIDADFEAGEFKIVAPITEYAQPDLQLTFAARQTMNIPR